MPDLNLIDEGGFEESSTMTVSQSKKKKPSGGGGGGKGAIILLFIFLLAGAAVYFLNQRGIIKLWGKKKVPIQQVQEEPFPPEVQQQAAQQEVKQDTSQISLLETPSVDEQKDESIAENKENENVAEAKSTRSKLSAMKGEYTVQVIAFREKKKADDIKGNLEAADYPAFVEKVPMKDGAWYRVCVGRYASRDAAKKAVKTFGTQLQASYVIDKVKQK